VLTEPRNIALCADLRITQSCTRNVVTTAVNIVCMALWNVPPCRTVNVNLYIEVLDSSDTLTSIH
jgi:hypothetical protein